MEMLLNMDNLICVLRAAQIAAQIAARIAAQIVVQIDVVLFKIMAVSTKAQPILQCIYAKLNYLFLFFLFFLNIFIERILFFRIISYKYLRIFGNRFLYFY